MSQKYNIIFYAIIVALVLVLPGQAVAVEDACSFIQDVNERVACEKIEPFPRACSVIKNDIDQGNCEKFNKRMATGMSSNTPPPPPPCNGPPGHECDQNADGTPVMHGGPPPWCTGPKGRECENEDGTPIQPPMQDACATIQDVNERLACQGKAPAPMAQDCSTIQDVNERLKCQGHYYMQDGKKVYIDHAKEMQKREQHKQKQQDAHERRERAGRDRAALHHHGEA